MSACVSVYIMAACVPANALACVMSTQGSSMGMVLTLCKVCMCAEGTIRCVHVCVCTLDRGQHARCAPWEQFASTCLSANVGVALLHVDQALEMRIVL